MTPALDIYRQRRHRDKVFGEHAALFGEPVWDMLLDLQHATTMEAAISVSSACIAASVPPTTALRHIGTMCDHGLVERRDDPDDGRRQFVSLTEYGRKLMSAATLVSPTPVSPREDERQLALRNIARLALSQITGPY